MKIGSLGVGYSNSNVRVQSFGGLQGIAYTRKYSGDIYTEVPYYPFSDETKQEIWAAERRIANCEVGDDKFGSMHITEMDIKNTLPFSAQQWDQYLSKQMPSKGRAEINNALKTNGLAKYVQK